MMAKMARVDDYVVQIWNRKKLKKLKLKRKKLKKKKLKKKLI